MSEGLQIQSLRFLKLARMLRLSYREIARRANVSATTAEGVLKGRREQFASKETEQRIFSVIETEAKSLKSALDRLSGGATA